MQRPRWRQRQRFMKKCLAYLYSPNLLQFFYLHQRAMINISASKCKKLVKKDVNCEKLHNLRYLEAKVVPQAKFHESMFSISIQSQLNITILLSTLGYFDQYFGVHMQKYSKKGRKLSKIALQTRFRVQGGAIGKIFRKHVQHIYIALLEYYSFALYTRGL